MNERKTRTHAPPPPVGNLRREAEQRLRDKQAVPAQSMAEADVRALLHELQVHQIELEMQNEELLRTQAALEAVSDKYQDLFDFAPVGYFLLDPQGQILEINLAGAALLGLDRSAAVNRRLGLFVALEHRAAFAEFCKRTATAVKQTCEIEFRRNEKPVYAVVEAVPAEQGEGDRPLRITVTDISERRRAEQTLKAFNENLEQLVAERTADVEQRAAQLQALAVELTQAEQCERRRLAEALHGGLQQMLVAARMKVGLLRKRVQEDQLVQTIGELDDLLNQTIDRSRSLAAELCPPILYECGLGAALEWLARQTQEKFDLAVEVETDPAAEPAEESTRVFLFQAAGELLLNAAKHSQAHRVWVRMSQTEQHQVHLEVCDDGIGFEPAQPVEGTDRGGFGMFSIRTRLEVLGGTMEVVSIRGQGTRILIRLPWGEPAISSVGP